MYYILKIKCEWFEKKEDSKWFSVGDNNIFVL